MCAMKIVTNSVSKNGTNTIPTNMTSNKSIDFDNKNSAHNFDSGHATPGIYYHYKDIGRKKNTFFVLII